MSSHPPLAPMTLDPKPPSDPIMYRCSDPACSCSRPGSDFNPRPGDTARPDPVGEDNIRLRQELEIYKTHPLSVVCQCGRQFGLAGAASVEFSVKDRENAVKLMERLKSEHVTAISSPTCSDCGRTMKPEPGGGKTNWFCDHGRDADAPELVILDREGTKCGQCGGELVCLECANKKWREEVAIPALTRLPSRLVEIATAACWALAGFTVSGLGYQLGWWSFLFGR